MVFELGRPSRPEESTEALTGRDFRRQTILNQEILQAPDRKPFLPLALQHDELPAGEQMTTGAKGCVELTFNMFGWPTKREVTPFKDDLITGVRRAHDPLAPVVRENYSLGHLRYTEILPITSEDRPPTAESVPGELNRLIDAPHGIPEVLEKVERSAREALGWRLFEGAWNIAHPGAGELIHAAREAYRWIKVGAGVLDGDGISITEEFEVAGVSIQFSGRVGARPGVPPIGIDPGWNPVEPNPHPEFKVGIGEGVAPENTHTKPPALTVRWFEPDRETLPATVQVRGGLAETATHPSCPQVEPAAELTGLALVAPVGEVAKDNFLSADAVVVYAEQLGILEADQERTCWHLCPGGHLTKSRLRRIDTIVYRDPDGRFAVIVELEPGHPPVISHVGTR